MEKEFSAMKSFLKKFNEEIQSPTSEEISYRVVNYFLDPEDVTGQVIDWILNYLDIKKCPYPLALAIAKEAAHQVSASFADIACNSTEEELEKSSNPTNLYSEAISKLPSICNSFLNQADLDSLCSTKYTTSVFAVKNKRRKMEDRHVVHHDLNSLLDLKDAPYQSYYAVFDGHSGIDAASYASAQLHNNIAKHPDFLSDTPKSIIEGYRITDLNFLNKCNKANIKSGCTALSALIRENVLYLSWLGDSLAVLVRDGVPQFLTNPHKPDREDERQRIEGLGGHVTHMGTWRVNGLLAVTRAIGDPDHKPFIISEPEVAVINLDGTEDFLILACDGLWDSLSPEDAAAVLYRCLADSSPDEPSDTIAAKLVHQSKLQGSEDNITAIVIFLRDSKDIRENSARFMTNASLPVQNQDFLSMNGSMKSPSTDIPFSKPTVLELNAASSKKLKNTANVMSSAGLESAFQYQYFENSMQASCQSPDSSVGGSHNASMSYQSAAASCFAPEATALSELPTPPIDDILASQQFENFYSTDLYKQFSSSMQATQNIQASDVSSTLDAISGSNNTKLSGNSALSPLVDDVVTSVDNMSLLDNQTNTNTDPAVTMSPDEAVDIASTIVSTAVETAVKCLSSSENFDTAPALSPVKLNPYAKPFVMKSFFNSEDTISQNVTNEINRSITEVDSKFVAESEMPVPLADNPPISNINTMQSVKDINIRDDKNAEQSVKVVHQSVVDDIMADIPIFDNANKPATNIVDVENQFQQDCISFLENTSSKPSTEQELDISSTDNRNPELNNKSFERQGGSVDQLLQGDITNDQIMDYGSNIVESATPQSVESPEKMSSPVPEIINLGNMVKMNTQEFVSEASTLEDVSSSLSHEIENLSLNAGSNSFGENLTTNEILELATPVEVANIDFGFVSSVTSEQELIEVNTPLAEHSEESNLPEHNQNVLDKVSVDLPHANKSEKDSKAEAIEKCLVTAVENEKSEIPDSTALLGSMTKEPISLMSVNNELTSAGAEVPSDPSVEDSHLDPVAVDLKSLPEGIPEAEGVTEDVDSDSEKDGGWSYMKGNTVGGSKSKPGQKTSKTLKPNDLKSASATKVKKDISKANLDPKGRIRSATADKAKTMMVDKTKTISVDKSKNATVSDKTKTSTTVDKMKTSAITERIRKTTIENKPDIKSRMLKSSTLSSSVKVTSDKTKMSTTVKKETVEISKPSVSKPTRPTTLLRTTAPASRPASTTVDRNAALNKATTRPTGSVPAKSKVGIATSENKSGVKTSSTISKGLPSTQSNKPSAPVRSAPSRPATTLPSRTAGVLKSAPLLKSSPADSKPKQPASTVARKPVSTTLKKPDVKEVKDNVNKQILAKRNTTTTRVESSSSTLASRRITSVNNKSTLKASGNAVKSELSKKDVPKVPPTKSVAKSGSSKLSQVATKGKEKNDAQCKTDDAKNSLNIEIEQKTVTEIAQVAEEKFILETSDKEVVAKEKVETPSEIKQEVIVENGSLSDSMTPVEEKIPPVECTPDNL